MYIYLFIFHLFMYVCEALANCLLGPVAFFANVTCRLLLAAPTRESLELQASRSLKPEAID